MLCIHFITCVKHINTYMHAHVCVCSSVTLQHKISHLIYFKRKFLLHGCLHLLYKYTYYTYAHASVWQLQHYDVAVMSDEKMYQLNT